MGVTRKERRMKRKRLITIAALAVLMSSSASADDAGGPTAVRAAEAAALRAFENAATVEYVSKRYDPRCAEFHPKGGPVAGIVISPMAMFGGAAMIAVGAGDKEPNPRDGKLTGVGKGLVAGGVVMAIGGIIALALSGRNLKQGNQKRHAQRLWGCPR
jgi:hypothetical protein